MKKHLYVSLFLASIIFTGCSHKNEIITPSNNIETKNIYNDPQYKEIEEYSNYKVKEMVDLIYKDNFVSKKIASSEDELGVYSINAKDYRTYVQEHISNDDLDIKPRIYKIVQRTNVIEKRVYKDVNGEEVLVGKEINKVDVTDKLKPIDKNKITDTNNFNKYSKYYPFVISIGDVLYKKELKTNKVYILAIDNYNGKVYTYQVKDECVEDMENYNISCFLPIDKYKISKDLSDYITIYFKFDGQKIKFYNQKFTKTIDIGEKFFLKMGNTLYKFGIE